MSKEEKVCAPLIDVQAVSSILSKISISGGLSAEQVGFLFTQLEKACYRADEFIFKQNDEPRYIYIIQSGSVKIVMDDKGQPLKLVTFQAGYCFGETAIIGIQRHTASALAVEDTELIMLSRKALLSIFDTDKDLFSKLILNIAREACRRLHRTDEILLHYVHHKRVEHKSHQKKDDGR